MNIYFVQNLQMFMEKNGISNTELAGKLGVFVFMLFLQGFL